MGYKIIEHTADTGIEAWGHTLGDLFANAARGMLEIVHGKQGLTGNRRITIELEGTDLENLLVRWLCEILYRTREGNLLAGFDLVQINHNKLKASCSLSSGQMTPVKTEIKLVTYHGLKIKKGNRGYKTRIIFDV
jgi:SHS2 domain-containing protein